MAQALFLFVMLLHLNKLVYLFATPSLVRVLHYLGGSEDSMLCTPYQNENPTLCTYLGEFPLDF